MNHIIDVLRGSKSQKVTSRRHDQLSTYGIGKDKTVDQWRLLGRTLLHQGLVSETTDGYPVLKLNAQSWEVLRNQRPVAVAVPRIPTREGSAATAQRRSEAEALFERLRSLRKQLADAQSVPPYVIFGDSSLKLMARDQPQTLAEFAQISGVGQRKLAQYGERFTTEIRAYRQEQGLPLTEAGSAQPSNLPPSMVKPKSQQLSNTLTMTLILHQRGLSPEQIARDRHIKLQTVLDHLAELLEQGQSINLEVLVGGDRRDQIVGAIEEIGPDSLSPIREHLGDTFDYAEIKLVRAWWRQQQVSR
jgi:ATP-dependent DNA helicase RecQ